MFKLTAKEEEVMEHIWTLESYTAAKSSGVTDVRPSLSWRIYRTYLQRLSVFFPFCMTMPL